jgi:hypothetical protein
VEQSSFLIFFGLLVIAWASVDLVMNLARVFFHYLAVSHHWSTAPSFRPDASS